jgi:hypothetical protein
MGEPTESKVSTKQGLTIRQKTTPIAKWSDIDKERLAQALGQVCTVQNAYGKKADDLPVMVAGFAWALRDFSVDDVVWALGEFMNRSPNFPTPFNIRQILQPPEKTFNPDKPYYIYLQKLRQEQGKFALNDEEEEYIRKYEAHVKSGG